jgi:hypothetical protein
MAISKPINAWEWGPVFRSVSIGAWLSHGPSLSNSFIQFNTTHLKWKIKGEWTWCVCPQSLPLSSHALWCMKTKPIHPSRALSPLSLLLLLACEFCPLPMASHHCKGLWDKQQASMYQSEKWEQRDNDEGGIGQQIYLDLSRDRKGRTSRSCDWVLQTPNWAQKWLPCAMTTQIVKQLQSNWVRRKSKGEELLSTVAKRQISRCPRCQIEWWEGLFRSRRCYLAWIERAIEWRDLNFSKREDETKIQLRNWVELSAIESERLSEVMKRCLNTT